MMGKKFITATLTATFLLCSSAFAQGFDLDIKPGLWEHSFSIESESGEMEKAIEQALQQLENLPESQRRMVEKMMESQGVNLDLASSSIEVCISEEDIQRGALPQQENCEQNIEQQSDDTFHFDFTCKGTSEYSGKGTMTIVDREHYRGDAEFTAEMSGRSEKMYMTQQGRWLSENCES